VVYVFFTFVEMSTNTETAAGSSEPQQVKKRARTSTDTSGTPSTSVSVSNEMTATNTGNAEPLALIVTSLLSETPEIYLVPLRLFTSAHGGMTLSGILNAALAIPAESRAFASELLGLALNAHCAALGFDFPSVFRLCGSVSEATLKSLELELSRVRSAAVFVGSRTVEVKEEPGTQTADAACALLHIEGNDAYWHRVNEINNSTLVYADDVTAMLYTDYTMDTPRFNVLNGSIKCVAAIVAN
jgi:hypothetical protein